ncbi:MAG: stage II sporulation protein M [Chitinivibrionales bacterium]|nr:stage II sporulation protein M [Chitinivibrionales bacterium]
MIVNLSRFIEQERRYWNDLEKLLDQFERAEVGTIDLEEIKQFHYLYLRAGNDLVKISSSTGNSEILDYLESLVSRAYGEIAELTRNRLRFKPLHFIMQAVPRAFRRRYQAFALAALFFVAGALLGAGLMLRDSNAKEVILPWFLQISPEQRVRIEESAGPGESRSSHLRFSSLLMTHNIRVSLATLCLGITFGLGTFLLLFYNGVILGAVAYDYLAAGQGVFLAGWLLPHGMVEIPAILLAGQAGFVLAGALVGWGNELGLKARFRKAGPDIVTLIGGLSIMLVWAGIVESFLSQYHEPNLPYSIKIAFGCVEGIILILFFSLCGRSANHHELT